jgi:hypothetical protein
MDKNPNTNESILELDAAEMQHVSGGDGFLSWLTGVIQGGGGGDTSVPASNAGLGIRG